MVVHPKTQIDQNMFVNTSGDSALKIWGSNIMTFILKFGAAKCDTNQYSVIYFGHQGRYL